LLLGFGVPDDGFDPGRRADVERALHAFYPEASLRVFLHHDWVSDPFARGTYVSVPATAPDLFAADAWRTAGPVVFAGSDIAAEESGWFEGALRSGGSAAAQVIALLGIGAGDVSAAERRAGEVG
jgi:monoamine oxidase